MSDKTVDPTAKTEADWARELTAEEFQICRKKGTERAFTGIYHDEKRDGVYRCKCCNEALFDSGTKYDSGSGWPSFYDALESDRIAQHVDRSYGMVRTEVTCKACGCHLGHLFPDGPAPTGMRYCINSASLNFEPES